MIIDIQNPLTTFALVKTILFQVGLLGAGSILACTFLIPTLSALTGVHPITEKDRYLIQSSAILRRWFKNAKKWFDHPFGMLAWAACWGGAFVTLTGTLYTYMTDVGWPPAFKDYSVGMALLMARASGQPNGSHLLSAIPLPLVGLYVAWKYRQGIFIDVFQGIMIVAFGLAAHEIIWLGGYMLTYYWDLNLGLLPNVIEDVCFGIAAIMLIFAFYKYPNRTMSMRIFYYPLLIYSLYICLWFLIGFPITTINNYQIGQGVFMTTQYWADPLTNMIEIGSWVLISVLFFLAIWRQKIETKPQA